MNIRQNLIITLLLLAASCNLSATAFSPKPGRDKVIIFDAAKDNINKIVNYTKHWLKGSDIIPEVKLAKVKEQQMACFTYNGTQGVGISRFDIKRKKLQELGKTIKFTGVSLLIDTPKDVTGTLEVRVYFDKTNSVIRNIQLKPGMVKYEIKAAKAQAKTINWGNIKWLWLTNKNPQLKFYLKTIAMTHSFYQNNNPDGWQATKLTKTADLGNGYAISVLPPQLHDSLLNIAQTAQPGTPAHFNCTLTTDTVCFAGPGFVKVPETAVPITAYIDLQLKNCYNNQVKKFKLTGFYLKRGTHQLSIANDANTAIAPFVIMLPRQRFIARQHELQAAGKVAVVPQSKTPITIDGRLDEISWQRATSIKLGLPDDQKNQVSNRIPQEKTAISMMHRNGKLYLGIKCAKANRQAPVINRTGKNHKLWKDECLEFYFAGNSHARNYIQLIVNSHGQWEFATKNDRIKENIIPAVKCSIQPDYWTLEAEIPINQMMNEQLEFIAFNITRTTYDKQGKQQERTGWNTIKYNDIPNYGLLKFQNKANQTATKDRLLLIADKKSAYQLQWEAMVSSSLQAHPAFVFPMVDNKLPNLLIMGDSVSMQYTPVVRKALAGKLNVFRVPANGGPVSRGLSNFKAWTTGKKWDIIIFNFGLHDSKYKGWDRKNKAKFSSPEIYRRQLKELVAKLKATGAKLFWVSTTPVQAGIKSNDKGSSVIYNKVAAEIMQKNNIPIIDLYAKLLPHIDKYFGYKNIHMSKTGIPVAGKIVAQRIKQYLKQQ